MLVAAARYSYPNAKIRALRAGLLSAEDRHFLEGAKDLEGFLSYLSTTSYARSISREKGKGLQRLPRLERSLARPLLEQYARLERAFWGTAGRALVAALFSRFECENLKVLLRAVHSGRTRGEVARLLYPLEDLGRLPWEELWEARGVSGLVARLGDRPFGRALRHALPRYEVQGNLFPLEMALDLASFREIEKAAHGLRGGWDKRMARAVLTPYVDILNISWIIRLRTMFGLGPEEVVNYSLPGGSMSLAHIHGVARAEDLDEFLNRIPGYASRTLAGTKGWEEVEPGLNRWFFRRLARFFLGPPFHIGVALAYLHEKELELDYLVSLMVEKAGGAALEPGLCTSNA